MSICFVGNKRTHQNEWVLVCFIYFASIFVSFSSSVSHIFRQNCWFGESTKSIFAYLHFLLLSFFPQNSTISREIFQLRFIQCLRKIMWNNEKNNIYLFTIQCCYITLRLTSKMIFSLVYWCDLLANFVHFIDFQRLTFILMRIPLDECCNHRIKMKLAKKKYWNNCRIFYLCSRRNLASSLFVVVSKQFRREKNNNQFYLCRCWRTFHIWKLVIANKCEMKKRRWRRSQNHREKSNEKVEYFWRYRMRKRPMCLSVCVCAH